MIGACCLSWTAADKCQPCKTESAIQTRNVKCMSTQYGTVKTTLSKLSHELRQMLNKTVQKITYSSLCISVSINKYL